jgi:hypothetical protein
MNVCWSGLAEHVGHESMDVNRVVAASAAGGELDVAQAAAPVYGDSAQPATNGVSGTVASDDDMVDGTNVAAAGDLIEAVGDGQPLFGCHRSSPFRSVWGCGLSHFRQNEHIFSGRQWQAAWTYLGFIGTP